MIKTNGEFRNRNNRRIALQAEIDKNIEVYQHRSVSIVELENMKRLYDEREVIEEEILEFFRKGLACKR